MLVVATLGCGLHPRVFCGKKVDNLWIVRGMQVENRWIEIVDNSWITRG
jgi:hypothetical protein